MKLSAVTPVYRNQSTLEELARRVFQAAAPLYDDVEYVFVVDGSPDGSLGVLRRMAAADPRIRVVAFTRNFGQHAAMLAGLLAADGDRIFVIDGDLEEDPATLPALHARIEEGFQVAAGVRGSGDRPLAKRLPARIYSALNAWLCDYPVIDNVTNMRLMTRRFVEHLLSFRERPFFGGITTWIGLPVGTVEVAWQDTGRRSSFTWRKLLSHARLGIVGFSTKLLRFSTVAGLCISAAAFLYGAWIAVLWLLHGQVVPGFSSLATLLAFLIGVQCIFIGILGEYVAEIFETVKSRPRFLVAETINLDPSRARDTARAAAAGGRS